MNGTHLLCATLAGNGAGMCSAPAGAAPLHFVAATERQTGIRCLPVRFSAPAQPRLPTGARLMPSPRPRRRSAVAAPGMVEAVI